MEVTLFQLEYNDINGFVFTLLGIDSDTFLNKKNSFEGALFSINAAREFLHIGLLFFTFEVKKPW